MAVVENAATSPEALAKWRVSMRRMDRAELMAQQLVQRGAEHALAELLKLGVTEDICAAMLASLREGLIEIHAAATERGIPLVDYSREPEAPAPEGPVDGDETLDPLPYWTTPEGHAEKLAVRADRFVRLLRAGAPASMMETARALVQESAAALLAAAPAAEPDDTPLETGEGDAR